MLEERLARIFRERVEESRDSRDANANANLLADTELGAQLVRLVESGRAAWPRLEVAPEDFVAHLARHAAASDAPSAFLAAVHASDLYLACGVVGGDDAALRAFEEHFMARVPEYILRVRIDRETHDEVQQRLRERLVWGRSSADPAAPGTPKLAEYSGKGALGGWLRVTAVRAALTYVRDAGRARGSTEEVPTELAAHGDPELAYWNAHAQELVADAFRRVLGGLDATERSMLRLHYVEGLTMTQLAQLFQTPRSTIARRVSEVREQILEATATLLRREQRLSPSSVESVLRHARSRLQLTLTRLL